MKNIAIIGAGLGGLTAGALLSKKGFLVTILEQNKKVGGCATTFIRDKGYNCEVGLHMMDSAFTDFSKNIIFKELGVYENIKFVKPNEFFRLKSNDIDFIMPNNKDKAISTLLEKFPSEAQSIEKYFLILKEISEEFLRLQSISWYQYLVFPRIFKNIWRFRNKSVKEVLDRLIKSEKLKLILNTNIFFYHDTICTFSFLYHALAQNSYFAGNAWYIRGGSQKLSDYLASIIKRNNGTVLTGASVVKINHDNRVVNSVVYKRKNEITALSLDMIISNLSPAQTHSLSNIPYKEKKKIASSLFTVHIGFNKNLRKIYGQKPYATFFFRDVRNVNEYDRNIKSEATERSFVFVDYSQIDSNLTNKNRSFGSLCTTDYYADWINLSKTEYRNKKMEIYKSYFEELNKEYPNIKEYVKFVEIGTPITLKNFLKTPDGTPYGFAPDSAQFFRKPMIQSKLLKNCYFVGAWVVGGGFSPAVISGGMCCNEILG